MRVSEVRDLIFQAQNGYCWLCLEQCTELHHRLSNTLMNRKLFPLYIDSPFNTVGLCYHCHHATAKEGLNVSEDVAVVYEAFLKELYCSLLTSGACVQSDGSASRTRRRGKGKAKA